MGSWPDRHTRCGIPCLPSLSPLELLYFLLWGLLEVDRASLRRGRSMGRHAGMMAMLGSTADQTAASA